MYPYPALYVYQLRSTGTLPTCSQILTPWLTLCWSQLYILQSGTKNLSSVLYASLVFLASTEKGTVHCKYIEYSENLLSEKGGLNSEYHWFFALIYMKSLDTKLRLLKPVFRIHMFSGSGSTRERYGSGSGSGSFYHLVKIVRKTLIPTVFFLLLLDFFEKGCNCTFKT